MGLRILLVVSGLVCVILGVLFVLSPDGAIAGFQIGEPDAAARLMARGYGASLLFAGIMNLLATRDSGSPALTAILAFNLLLNLVPPLIDLTEDIPITAGYWVTIVIHTVFIIGFGYYLIFAPRNGVRDIA